MLREGHLRHDFTNVIDQLSCLSHIVIKIRFCAFCLVDLGVADSNSTVVTDFSSGGMADGTMM